MKNKSGKSTFFILIVILCISFGIYLKYFDAPLLQQTNSILQSLGRFVVPENEEWGKECNIVNIKSSYDGKTQKAYFYKSTSGTPTALIVSLHTWGGNFSVFDTLSVLSVTNNVNYIHPDFRGPNNKEDACCSEMALSDIDDAISYALKHANVDPTRISVIGASGGGYACLGTFMKSKHYVANFSAWVPITDLSKWYLESKLKNNGIDVDILNCTSSKNGRLNENMAKRRSPIHWKTPLDKLTDSKLNIYAGVYDGLHGSVSILHSINFFNKLLADSKVSDSTKYVSKKETQQLLEFRKPIGHFGKISERSICLMKKHRNIKLVIFDGQHEMLEEYAFNELLEDK